MATTEKDQLLAALRTSLQALFTARYKRGASDGRAQGYVDGYMRALIDSGLFTQRELLHLVAEERVRAQGPGWAELDALSTEAA